METHPTIADIESAARIIVTTWPPALPPGAKIVARYWPRNYSIGACTPKVTIHTPDGRLEELSSRPYFESLVRRALATGRVEQPGPAWAWLDMPMDSGKDDHFAIAIITGGAA